MNNFFRSTIIAASFLIVLSLAQNVSAQSWLKNSSDQLSHAAGANGAEYGAAIDPRYIVANIIRLLLSLVGTILFVLMAYSGFRWMTAQGNDEQIAGAKKTIYNSTIGLVIVLSAYALTILITNLAMGRKITTGTSQGSTLDSAVQNWFR